MSQVERIRAKIRQIEALCADVEAELDALATEAEGAPKKPAKDEPVAPTPEEVQREFERLYSEYQHGNPQAVVEFVRGKSKDYLKVFCKSNNLSVDATKASKDRVTESI